MLGFMLHNIWAKLALSSLESESILIHHFNFELELYISFFYFQLAIYAAVERGSNFIIWRGIWSFLFLFLFFS